MSGPPLSPEQTEPPKIELVHRTAGFRRFWASPGADAEPHRLHRVLLRHLVGHQRQPSCEYRGRLDGRAETIQRK